MAHRLPSHHRTSCQATHYHTALIVTGFVISAVKFSPVYSNLSDDEGEADVNFLDDLQQDILQRDAGIHKTASEDSNHKSADIEDAEENNFLDSDDDGSND